MSFIDIRDGTDALVGLTIGATAAWLSWLYWPGAHEAIARFAHLYGC